MTNQKSLERSIEGVAAMKALSDMLGMERATRIVTGVVDKEGYDVMASVGPTADDYSQCGDAFVAFREYMKAHFAAEERSGFTKAMITEEDDSVTAFRIDRCALLEIAKAFGNPSLIYPMYCHTDEVYYPRLTAQLGWKFSCTSKAAGAPECSWKLERSSSPTVAKNSK